MLLSMMDHGSYIVAGIQGTTIDMLIIFFCALVVLVFFRIILALVKPSEPFGKLRHVDGVFCHVHDVCGTVALGSPPPPPPTICICKYHIITLILMIGFVCHF